MCITDSGWCITVGGWCTTDGGWCTTDGGWCITDSGWCITVGGWCTTDGGWCITDSGWCITVGGWCTTDGGLCITDSGWALHNVQVGDLVEKLRRQVPADKLASAIHKDPNLRNFRRIAMLATLAAAENRYYYAGDTKVELAPCESIITTNYGHVLPDVPSPKFQSTQVRVVISCGRRRVCVHVRAALAPGTSNQRREWVCGKS